ncbi:GyrI-like domain-containing protein [Bacillus licheniformis]|uniref:GyrI-like domain-containing protein n=1 Tax=Bacillus licheniformis TaxID=1402 RepID=UPI002E1CAE0E
MASLASAWILTINPIRSIFEKNTAYTPAGCVEKTIPAATWAVFEAIGPVNPAGQATWERIFSECFPATGYELANEPQFEAYPEDGDIMAQDHITEIWIPVVSRNNPEREKRMKRSSVFFQRHMYRLGSSDAPSFHCCF